jgi:hypothetical protein
VKKHLLTCWLVFLALYQPAMADSDGRNALAHVMAAGEMARANVQCAWIYGIAIVIAGIAIGIGLFFGLKSRK